MDSIAVGGQMPRQDRLDFKGAIHITRIRGGQGLSIFFDPGILKPGGLPPRKAAIDLRRFERLMAAAGEECRVLVHAYSVEPNRASLLLQTNGAPLVAFMRRLCGQYARYLRFSGRVLDEQCVFAGRYESKIVSPEYVPHAVRRIHRAPVEAGYCKNPMDYPFSSVRAYAGQRTTLPIEMNVVSAALLRRGYPGARGYVEFMQKDENSFIFNLFEKGSPRDSRIVGRTLFVKQARILAAQPPTVPTRAQLITGAALLLKQPETEIYAPSHTGALGRALVAWYAVRSGAATLSGVGQWFSVTGATLGQGIRHYRRVAGHLFELPHLPTLNVALEDDPTERAVDDETDSDEGDLE